MSPSPDETRTGLKPPRFGLGGLLGGVAALGLVFAFIHYAGMYGGLIAILFFLCVIAHVAGNAIGTRLREIGSEPAGKPPGDASDAQPPGRLWPREVTPATRLRERRSLGRPIVIITAAGALAGAAAGGLVLSWLTEGRAPWTVVSLGVAACAVLGGIWTFAAASFVQVTLGAWLQAVRDPRRR